MDFPAAFEGDEEVLQCMHVCIWSACMFAFSVHTCLHFQCMHVCRYPLPAPLSLSLSLHLLPRSPCCETAVTTTFPFTCASDTDPPPPNSSTILSSHLMTVTVDCQQTPLSPLPPAHWCRLFSYKSLERSFFLLLWIGKEAHDDGLGFRFRV
jgi:hypothetical protein